MCTEIEAKLKVDSLMEVEHRLAELGAEFVAEQAQTDYFFDDANAALTATDRCLRLRRQAVAGNERFFLTYKGAKEKDNFKKRQELELEILEAGRMEELLSALGYEKVLTIEKKRNVWKYGGCSVALDRLPLLGNFAEIEGPDDATIAGVQQSLGLADLPHIAKSYAQLTREKRAGRHT
jgi:adenylate cyclase class 2